jgi:hypothetical protein
LNIANSQTNGILNIGTNARSGAINIATVTGSTCGINILNGNGATTGGSVNIANGTLQTTTVNIASGTGTGAVTIGNSANTTDLKGGTINLQTDATTGGSVNIKTGATSTGDVNIKSGTTSGGAVNIATGTGLTQTTSVAIGSGTTSGAVTIGNSLNTTSINSNNILMNSTSGYTNIYGGTNVARNTGTVANTYIEMFSGSPNAIIDFHSGGVVNNDFDSRITSFGGSSSTDPAVNNGKALLELLASTVQIAGTLQMTEGKNIILQPTAGYLAPTANTMLGGITDGTFTLPTFPLTTSTNIATISLVKATYIIFISFQLDTGSPTHCWINFEGGTALPALNPSGSTSYRFGNSTLVVGANLQISGSFPYSCTTAGTVIAKLHFSGGSISSIPIRQFQAMRIA